MVPNEPDQAAKFAAGMTKANRTNHQSKLIGSTNENTGAAVRHLATQDRDTYKCGNGRLTEVWHKELSLVQFSRAWNPPIGLSNA